MSLGAASTCLLPSPTLLLKKQRPKNGYLSLGVEDSRSKSSAFIISSRAQKKETIEDYRKMKQWKEANRPRPPGFGHDKTYDTSLEDNLVAEIEQSRKAFVNKTKRTAEKHAGKVRDETQLKERRQRKSLESILGGVNVQIGNLPKKKNIVRDLQVSFKGYPGLLHINPVESGNKKTRDPICKGSAFFVFKNEDVANRFIIQYNGESIVFGKIEKKITCCLASPSGLANSGFVSPTSTTMYNMPRLRIQDKGIEFTEGITDSAVFQHQQKENHAKSSVDLGSGHGNRHDNVSGENVVDNSVCAGCSSIIKKDGLDPPDTRPTWKDLNMSSSIMALNEHALMVVDALECYEHSGITNNSILDIQKDPHKDWLLYQDLDKGVQCSDSCPKLSDDITDVNTGRILENVGKSTSRDGKLGNVAVSEYIKEQQEPPQKGSNIVQASGTQTLPSKVKNCTSMKKNIASIVSTSHAKKRRQKQKGQKEHKNKKAIETNPSDTIASLLGSANRLKKKGRNVLSAVLVKYGQHAVSSKS
ncbi:hypothetical protein KI387_016873 [Taxus chinensis]|uniref:RRM domain-containing protein n=1 Tax=Taxus chinensis TaxID=29808 RepID=A0AA38LFA0_TAXCH|nr:hypothetical protein KI387_016873 [Taxus chinensis]